MKQSEIKALVIQTIETQKYYVNAFSGSNNPQVIDSRVRHEAKLEAYEAVLDALNGNAVFLKCDIR